MTDALSGKLTKAASVVLSIEHDQHIDLAADGTTVRGYETYIREYVGMLESGLMARLSNAAYKILHALALRARILGDPRRPGAEEEFQELARLGIVTQEDNGHLFCFPSREQLMQDAGIGSVHTIDSSVDELAEMKIVKRITPAQPRLTRGLFGSNVYIIHPESFIGKFSSGDGEQKVLSVNGGGEQKPPAGYPVESTGSSLRNAVHRALKITNNERPEEEIEIISKHFAARVGIERYDPSEKEERKLAALLAEGYTVAQICAGITRAVERAAQTDRQIHSIAYCMPVVREHAIQETERKAVMAEAPQPETVPGQSPAVTQPTPEHQSMADPDPLAGGDAELRDLVDVVQERNPGRRLQKSDVRAWQAVAERFRDLAIARETTPIGLVMQAVLKAIGSRSDREGYLAPRLAEAILEDWQRSETEKNPPIVERPPDLESRARGGSCERRTPNTAWPAFQTPDGAMDAGQVWKTALGELKGQMTKATFDAWIKPTFVADAQAGDSPTLVVGTHNPYAVEWLEHRFHATIQRTVVGIVGKNVTVRYVRVE